MLNISSMKELLQKPSEIQWNKTVSLAGKLKRKISWALSYKILPAEIRKTWEIAIFGGTLGAWESMWNSMVFLWFWISESFSLYLLVENRFILKLGFFTYFDHISGGIIRKNILHSDYHCTRWYWCKKDQKNLPQISHKIFSQCLIVTSSLLWAFMVQNVCKNSFSGGKSRKNGIPVIKITFSLQKIPQNYRFPWVNTKTIKYTYGFNTS